MNEFFVKINGTAIGTIFAPTYATLSLGYFELIFYRMCINESGGTLGQFILENWCRFLDDCETPFDKTNELRKQKQKQTVEVLRFISAFNQNNPLVYKTINNSVEVLKRNNVPGFESIKLINSTRQPPNLEKLLTKAEFSNEGVIKNSDILQ